MALQSAMAPAPLEKFATEEEASDEDRFSLRLSEGEDEEAGEHGNQKTAKITSTTTETEEEILNKFETADLESDNAFDEEALLNEKQDDTLQKSDKIEETSAVQLEKQNEEAKDNTDNVTNENEHENNVTTKKDDAKEDAFSSAENELVRDSVGTIKKDEVVEGNVAITKKDELIMDSIVTENKYNVVEDSAATIKKFGLAEDGAASTEEDDVVVENAVLRRESGIVKDNCNPIKENEMIENITTSTNDDEVVGNSVDATKESDVVENSVATIKKDEVKENIVPIRKEDEVEAGSVATKEDKIVEECAATIKEDKIVDDRIATPENDATSDVEQMDVDEAEEQIRTDNAIRLRELSSVTKDLKDTVDTEDLLQLTDVKEADAANEISSSSSSEKDDSEDMADPSVDDATERDDDNEDVLDRPSDSMDCTDMMDIEENNPLVGEVSEEMDKDYENLLNSEKLNELAEKANIAKETDVQNSPLDNLKNISDSLKKTDDMICNDSANILEKEASTKPEDIDPLLITENRKAGDESQKLTTDEVHEESKDPLHNGFCDEPGEENAKKSVKRSLSECETEVGSKKLRLTESQQPSEPKIVILQTLTEFMRSKSLKKLSRRNLEEFCIEKICEVLIHKSEVGELRHQLQTQEQMMEFWKKETVAMTKQVKDLEIVNKKMLNELKIRQEKDAPPVPVKITRSVGLQVKLENVTSKRLSRNGSEITPIAQSPSKTLASIGMKSITNKSASPQIVRQNKETPTSTVLAATLLSQALTKDTPIANNNSNGSSSIASNGTETTNNTAATEAKGVIDLTDEDDKIPPTTATTTTGTSTTSTGNTTISIPSNKSQTATVRATAGIAIVSSKPSATGATTNTAPKFMYVLQPNPQLSQSVTTDLSKNGGPKTFMFRLQNGVLGSTNGILPTIQNTSIPQNTVRTGQVRLQAPAANSVVRNRSLVRHPAPLPSPPTPLNTSSRKPVPPKPQLSIRKSGQGIVLSWKLPYSLENYEVIASYQLYAYQETSAPPSTDMWRKVGDVKALALPMACTLTQFADGNKYYFAVRAVDVLKRIGPFSDPEPISL